MIWQCRDFSFSLDRVRVMGIVNVTPDSYSDAGKCFDAEAAIARGIKLMAEGADIVDVGGESSRPGAVGISSQEEIKRVLPVVKGLVKAGAMVSVDTRRPEVAGQALLEGARIVNDISASQEMFNVAQQTGAGLVLMRGGGSDWWAQKQPPVDIETVGMFLAGRVAAAKVAGIAREALVIDPGIGFTSNAEEDAALLRGIGALAHIAPVMVGVSRKRFIGKISGEAEPSQRLGGSLAAALFAVSRGARIVRAHDVAATVQALRVWEGLSHGE